MYGRYFRNKLLARHGSGLLVLAIALPTTFYAWQAARQHVEVKDRARFRLHVERTQGQIVDRMESCEEVLRGAHSLFAASISVERHEFTAYARNSIAGRERAGLAGLAFVASVPQKEQDTFLAATRADGCPDFEIRPNGVRQSYYPITYLEPSENNDLFLGFDVGTVPGWRAALERARYAQVDSLVGGSQIVGQMEWDHPLVFMNMPVYRNDMAQDTVSQRRAALSGWVVAGLHMDGILEGILSDGEGQYDVKIFDASEISTENMVHDHDGILQAVSNDHDVTFRQATTFLVAGHVWALHVATTPAFDQASDDLMPRIVLGGGLLISCLLFTIVYSLSSKREAAQKLAERMTASLRVSEAELREAHDHLELRVRQRTKELSRTNRALQEEVFRRTIAEGQLERKLEEIHRINTELNDFAYIVSHDLKAPLRAICSLAHWIKEDNADSLDEEGQENLTLLIDRTGRMNSLIEGILRYSRIGRLEPTAEPIDSHQTALDVIDSLAPPKSLDVRIEGTLPKISYDRTHLTQLFQNLVGNAITHLDKPHGRIVVSARDIDRFWEFSVRDTGVGIDEKHFERIFKIFQSLKPRDEVASTGIGLSLVKAITERHGGTVRVESTLGEGSTFSFTVPKPNASNLNATNLNTKQAVSPLTDIGVPSSCHPAAEVLQ